MKSFPLNTGTQRTDRLTGGQTDWQNCYINSPVFLPTLYVTNALLAF